MTASAQGDPAPAEGSRARCWRAAVVLAALLSTACGAALMKLPRRPVRPPPDAADALSQATAACRAVSTITAEIGVSGSVGGQRMRARLLAGLAAPASARLEARRRSASRSSFLSPAANDATLLLPRDGRVLEHGRRPRCSKR